MAIKLHGLSNEQVIKNLEQFPQFSLKSKLKEIMKDRGMTLQELHDLTGIRIATLSEIVNMKKSTLSVSHILVIALALRITDIGELFEFKMPDDTRGIFERDQEMIEKQGILPDQDEYLRRKRMERKNKEKPTS